MKRVIALMLSVLALAGCAGVMPMETKDMQMQKVIEVPGTTKDALFDKSRMWYAAAFRKANAVIQYENKENGRIMGNGIISISELGTPRDLKISVETEVKENRSRITVSGLTLSDPRFGEMGVQKRYWDEFKIQINDMMNGYEQYLKGPALGPKAENW